MQRKAYGYYRGENMRVGVLFGGKTLEHEISVMSALQAMNSMEQHTIIPLYFDKNNHIYSGEELRHEEIYQKWNEQKKKVKKVDLKRIDGKHYVVFQGLKKRKKEIDIILPIVHGKNSEDGTIYGYLNLLDIPYVGPSIYGAVVSQDKAFMKHILNAKGISILPFIDFRQEEYEEHCQEYLEKMEAMNYPLIVKPAKLGSSIGIKKVENREELLGIIETCFSYDDKIVVEQCLEEFKEFNCAVLGYTNHLLTSVIEEIKGYDGVLTYEDKYQSQEGMVQLKRVVPAIINLKMKKEIEELSKKTFFALEGCGMSRIDFLYDSKKKKVYVNEINTMPGSLSFYLWEKTDLKFSQLIDKMLENAIEVYRYNKKFIPCLDESVFEKLLGNFSFKK